MPILWSLTCKSFMLSVILLNVNMLSVMSPLGSLGSTLSTMPTINLFQLSSITDMEPEISLQSMA
jgi:hypothetical protein